MRSMEAYIAHWRAVREYWTGQGLSARVAGALIENGVEDIAQLRALGRAGLQRLHRLGPVGRREIEATIGWGEPIPLHTAALTLRTAARELLEARDLYLRHSSTLERIAAWQVDGAPFGDWVGNPAAEAAQRPKPAGAV